LPQGSGNCGEAGPKISGEKSGWIRADEQIKVRLKHKLEYYQKLQVEERVKN